MKPAKTISPPDWVRAPATIKTMEALGWENARFVGGCVRNTLLGVPVTDIDIATKHYPEKVIELLEGQGIKAIPTGIEHGTITAICKDTPHEITTLRKDVATDGRRATIAFADSWEEDAARRDFTINTLLMDMDGNLYDPTGQGIADLESRSIRFVGDAETRIKEDILRILRFFRFHAQYGAGQPDQAALKACAKHADKIQTLSIERITQEFLKILMVKNPADILDVMRSHKVLIDLIDNLSALKKLTYFQTQYKLESLPARLFALIDYSSGNIPQLETHLLIPKLFKKDMAAINKVLKMPNLNTDQTIKESLYRHGRTASAQALMIELSQDRVNNKDATNALGLIQSWEIPSFPITGEDLIKEGFTPGHELGQELRLREQAWIDKGFL